MGPKNDPNNISEKDLLEGMEKIREEFLEDLILLGND